MPELLEIEMYRRGAANLVGRRIAEIEAPDDWYLKHVSAPEVEAVLTGSTIEAIDRIGKLMVLRTDTERLGLRYGMTGRLVVDGAPVIDVLEYSALRLDPSWNRFALRFTGGGSAVMNDPRRLGGVELNPDLTKLGPDAWSISYEAFRALTERTGVALKALLLNQKRIAGLGNLLVDELLWRAGIAPTRSANELRSDEVVGVHEALVPMLNELFGRGGSNTGDLFPERSAEGVCPRDGHSLRHGTVGGRSTWWCPHHQQ